VECLEGRGGGDDADLGDPAERLRHVDRVAEPEEDLSLLVLLRGLAEELRPDVRPELAAHRDRDEAGAEAREVPQGLRRVGREAKVTEQAERLEVDPARGDLAEEADHRLGGREVERGEDRAARPAGDLPEESGALLGGEARAVAAVEARRVRDEGGEREVGLGELQALGAGEGEPEERPRLPPVDTAARRDRALEDGRVEGVRGGGRPPEGAGRGVGADAEAQRARERDELRGDRAEVGVRQERDVQEGDRVRRGLAVTARDAEVAAGEGEDAGPGPAAARLGREPLLAVKCRAQRLGGGSAGAGETGEEEVHLRGMTAAGVVP
jgi:hypothetical protein